MFNMYMKANGRIDILNAPNHLTLYDVPQNHTSTYKDAMRGNWENTLLSQTFFSVQNQQILQNGIRAGVYKESNGKYIISEQSDNELKLIMRGIFLERAENKSTHITEQIRQLNQYVLSFAIPRVLGEVKGYMKYLQDASTLVVPLSHPIQSSIDKTLELKPFF
jgi:hypothetical protein